ncbi:ATP-dependent Clp protease adapter protein ClpS [Roseibium aggregatum]|jgi:ATP-dependent Clp protease adaptor protein ClpS|uniref:ATP-dependent Clp protease adapter protein ClpS n=3 Tax=Roseibium TaxID=150830 RepID=A0A0M6XXJ4_9HYPH|nr:ATP-dependent Clp protease adapter protein ClpS [Roseibium aggregatum]
MRIRGAVRAAESSGPAAQGSVFRIRNLVMAGVIEAKETAMSAGSDYDNDGGDAGTVTVTRTKTVTKRPNLYRVLLLNDDYTPMEFVIHVVENFFQKNREEATRIMLHVHHHGVGECGIYSYEVAETKVTQVMDFARKHQHPLQCVMEKK